MDNIFTELRDIIGNEYDFRVEISSIEFNVILSREMFEDFEITVTYGFEEFPYVNFQSLHNYLEDRDETLKDYDYGYDDADIHVINDIMDWMNANSNKLMSYMGSCDKDSKRIQEQYN